MIIKSIKSKLYLVDISFEMCVNGFMESCIVIFIR